MSWDFVQSRPKKAAIKEAGVTVGCRITAAGASSLIVALNARAVAQFFHAVPAGGRVAAGMGRGPDAGALRLVPVYPTGTPTLAFGRGPRGSARISVPVSGAQFREAQKSAPCAIHWDGAGLVVTLPAWAGATGARAAMEAEFGLKREHPAPEPK